MKRSIVFVLTTLSRAAALPAMAACTDPAGIEVDWEACNLSDADLNGAELKRANLSGTDLSGADLTSAGLNRANLSGANLSGANMLHARLNDANLSGADLSGATMFRGEWAKRGG